MSVTIVPTSPENDPLAAVRALLTEKDARIAQLEAENATLRLAGCSCRCAAPCALPHYPYCSRPHLDGYYQQWPYGAQWLYGTLISSSDGTNQTVAWNGTFSVQG